MYFLLKAQLIGKPTATWWAWGLQVQTVAEILSHRSGRWQFSQAKKLGSSSKPCKTSGNCTNTLIWNTVVEHPQKFKMFFHTLSSHQLNVLWKLHKNYGCQEGETWWDYKMDSRLQRCTQHWSFEAITLYRLYTLVPRNFCYFVIPFQQIGSTPPSRIPVTTRSITSVGRGSL